MELATTGTLLASTTVHLHPMGHPPSPFVVGVVHLDDGPAVQAWVAVEPSTSLPVGARVRGVLVPRSAEDLSVVDLAFAPEAELMVASLSELRPVFVVGVGLHRYQRGSDTSFVELGLAAVREALADAAMEWSAVESAHTGNVHLGMAAGRSILRHLGATGLAVAQVENASASGSTAFRLACLEVASGTRDVALALGVDKPNLPGVRSCRRGSVSSLGAAAAGRPLRPARRRLPAALRGERRAGGHGRREEPRQRRPATPTRSARRREPSTRCMGEAPLAGSLTRLQCCPIGEGAAAVLVASASAIDRLGLDR